MGEQLTLPFDAIVEERRRSPTWDDVQKGTAEYYTKYEPCDHCEGEEFNVRGYWDGTKCWHTAERYAYPKQQPNGLCRRGYLRWKDST